jgi:hypothetical protein
VARVEASFLLQDNSGIAVLRNNGLIETDGQCYRAAERDSPARDATDHPFSRGD